MDTEEEDDPVWDVLDTVVGGADGAVDTSQRVILHFDLDCFYAQVEMIRNPALRSKPVGVQQKYIIVTCNYVARERGVTKLMGLKEALQKCPDLVLVKGEDLTHYREISYKVTELLMSYCPLVERLGFDENFVDITEMVENRMENTEVSELSFVGHIYRHEASTVGVREHSRLALGSVIAAELREALWSKLGLTSCAGVANSKLLAKLVSGSFKPNQQTTLLPQSSGDLMSSLSGPCKVPGIGYRTGEKLKAVGVVTVRDLQVFPLRDLIREFGESNARRIQNLACGIDLSPVTPTGPPQSLSDEDSFRKISTVSEVERKVKDLLVSLCERMRKDGRLPQTVRLTLRRASAQSRWFSRESRQCSVPPHTAHKIITGCSEALSQMVSISMKLFLRLVDVSGPFHLTLLNVCFTNLQSKTSKSISSFFTHSCPTAAHTQEQHPGTSEESSFTNTHQLTASSTSQLPLPQPVNATASTSLRRPISELSDETESRTSNTHTKSTHADLPPDVDPHVFQALPRHIQMEIMADIQTAAAVERPGSSHSQRPHTDPPAAPQHSQADSHHSNELTGSAHSSRPDIPPNVDPLVFSQLPADMQRELLAEWKQHKPTLKISSKHPPGRERRTTARSSQSNSLLKYFKPS